MNEKMRRFEMHVANISLDLTKCDKDGTEYKDGETQENYWSYNFGIEDYENYIGKCINRFKGKDEDFRPYLRQCMRDYDG